MAVRCLLGCHDVIETMAAQLRREKDRVAALEATAADLIDLNNMMSARLVALAPRAPWWRRLFRRHKTDG